MASSGWNLTTSSKGLLNTTQSSVWKSGLGNHSSNASRKTAEVTATSSKLPYGTSFNDNDRLSKSSKEAVEKTQSVNGTSIGDWSWKTSLKDNVDISSQGQPSSGGGLASSSRGLPLRGSSLASSSLGLPISGGSLASSGKDSLILRPTNGLGQLSGSTNNTGGAGPDLQEFSAKDEYYLRRSFLENRPEMNSKGLFSYSGNWDTDRGRETPDSMASSNSRMFLNSPNGGIRVFNIDSLGNRPSSDHNGTIPKEPFDTTRSSGRNGESMLQRVSRLVESTRARLSNTEQSTPPKETFQQQPFDMRRLSGPNAFDDEDPKKQANCFPKFLLFVAILVLAIVGLVVVLVTQSDSKPNAQMGNVIEDHEVTIEEVIQDCPNVTVFLRQRIGFLCRDVYPTRPGPTLLVIVPPPYVNRGNNIHVLLNSEDQTEWMASLDDRGRLNVTGPLSTCSLPGTYVFTLLDQKNTSLYSTETNLIVKSEILQVNVTLTQAISNSSDENDFTFGCSTNSGCEKSHLDFFGEANNNESSLRGVNFTCLISYNDFDGYGVSCVGTIPDYLMKDFGRITCRPRSDLLDNFTKEEIKELEQALELPECDISKHCGYKCKNIGDYFVVNSGRCDIFHRCYGGRVYTEYCAPGTFFDPSNCACRHTANLLWCQDNGALRSNLYDTITPKECIAGTN